MLHPQSRFRDKRQISRGKLDCFPHATAEFTTIAFDGYGLRGRVPARPATYASNPVLVHRLVRLLHASFRPHLTMTPLRFAMTSPPSGCQKDFHLRAVEHARHTTKPLRGGPISPSTMGIESLRPMLRQPPRGVLGVTECPSRGQVDLTMTANRGQGRGSPHPPSPRRSLTDQT